ncbi:ferredoxin [Catenulispora pinisilvae]|uniref:ferredoxin n=1 Tax=Catenulispora pinisilvae TaxID=2705253 RepID=UPI001891BD8B|nr:ferredoxin [Catenulispora pinisilvae]
MRVMVDLARCQSYGQCVFAAPEIFEISGREVLEYDSAPSDEWRLHLERARAACPVQAITIGPAAGPGKDDGQPSTVRPAADSMGVLR